MEVIFQDGDPDSGDACGMKNLKFPPFYGVSADPSGTRGYSEVDTEHTRKEPLIIFDCQPGKSYHLLMADALAGRFYNKSFNHWLKLNLVCPKADWGGQAQSLNNGRDMNQGAGNIPTWFSGKGYMPPAFPWNTYHHFGFYIYETDTPFTNAELDQIDIDFPVHNQLGASYLVEQVASKILKITSPPVARNWIDIRTSYWSAVRMGRLAPLYPAIKDTAFIKLVCPCNLEITKGKYVDKACDA